MKRILVLALAFTVLVFSVYPLNGHVQIVASATATAAMEACYDDETDLNYYLYTPENSAEGMPLIVYLHGGSGKGRSLSLLTDVDGFPQYLQQGLIAPHAYVLLPQLPESQRGWEQVGEKLVTLIQKTVKAYSLDEKNISLTGHSMGGSGTWSLALSYPQLFARIAPLSGALRTQDVTALQNMAVWAFVGAEDTIVPPASSQNAVATLALLGADAQITTFAGADHFDVPALTYLDDSIGLLPWLTGEGAATVGTVEQKQELPPISRNKRNRRAVPFMINKTDIFH